MKTRAADPLATITEVSQILGTARSLRASLSHVLEVLEEDLGSTSGAVTLLTEQGDVALEAATGIRRPAARVRYRLGEGITGRVVQSGKPIVVPQVTKEPLFLDRSGVLSESKR